MLLIETVNGKVTITMCADMSHMMALMSEFIRQHDPFQQDAEEGEYITFTSIL
jgi:hypothetical protein